MNKSYKTTVTLRKKPLSKGRQALILDYYIANTEYDNSKPKGKRIRQHLGLYLVPETTPDAILANKEAWTNVELALENQETVSKAKIELIKTIKAIEGLIRDKKLRAICRSNLSELEFEFENYLPVANEHPYLPNIETLSKAINKLNALLEE